MRFKVLGSGLAILFATTACGPSERRETQQQIVDSFESWEANVHPSSCSWRYGLPRCPYAGRYEDEITDYCNKVASSSKDGLDALLQVGWRIQSHEDWERAGDENMSDGTALRITCKGQRYIIVRTCVTKINLFGNETPDPRCVAIETASEELQQTTPDESLTENASDKASSEEPQTTQDAPAPPRQEASAAAQKPSPQPITQAQGRALADSVSEQIKPCYHIPDNLSDSAWDIKTTFRLLLDRNGRLSSPPMMTMQSGVRAEYESEAQLMEKAAERAITQCTPLKLPAELYDGGWEDMEIVFNPRTFQ